MGSPASAVPAAVSDPVNAAILAVSEDRLAGFQVDPFGEIAARSGVDVDTVIERVRGMLLAGTIRRVRQTLMATNLARGALCAWHGRRAYRQCGGAYKQNLSGSHARARAPNLHVCRYPVRRAFAPRVRDRT